MKITINRKMNFQDLVKEFMLTAGQQFPIENKEELAKVLEERKGYLLEEINELEYAIYNDDRVEMIDAICDIDYVALGSCNVVGVNADLSLKNKDLSLKDLYNKVMLLREFTEVKSYDNVSLLSIEIAHILGFSLETIQEAFKRVHESNMSKFCKTKKEADQTQSHYYYSLDTKTYIEENNGYYVVKRASDNKVLKSVNYKRVDLTDLV